ncbi:MAG TPA: hypothetical protein VNN73_19725, partial [Blastocatellia bacterium]|nr:hypothetical protein [Blastocatellia bacterium]
SLNRPIQVWHTGAGGDDAGSIRPALPAGVAATSDVTISYNNFTSSQARWLALRRAMHSP